MPENGKVQGRRWIFADCEYLEWGRQLRVQGAVVRIEAKPLDVLQGLLERPTEVVPKDVLLGGAWEEAASDQSLATAVSKLRKAFGGPRDRILLSVPGVGYRMAVPVVCIEDRTAERSEFSLKPGDPIPFREQWHALRPLDARTPNMVWVGEQRRTGEKRVFKFATDGIRLRALQREVTLSRLFATLFPASNQFVRILEWNFDEAPYFTEAPFAGGNLADLVSSAELDGSDDTVRAALVAQIARAVADAHSVGVLHNDLKPSNILVVGSTTDKQEQPGTGTQRWQVRVVDFGIAVVSDLQRLQDLNLTDHGEFAESSAAERTTSRGTMPYLAPELRQADAKPDTRADIYALGVILYQVLCGDMQAPLALGWEERIADPLLREDIQGACQMDPQRRWSSAAELAQRLEQLPERRAARQLQQQDRQERQQLEQAVVRARVRQPWIMATAAVLLLGVCGTAWFFVRAAQERNEAVRRGETLAALNRFLTVDLLSQANPDAEAHRTPAQQVTLLQAINQARSQVDARFGGAPDIAARIHLALANIYGALSSFGDSEREYLAAAERFEQAGGRLSQDALQARLREVNTLMLEQTPKALAAARTQLTALQPRLGEVKQPGAELQGWSAMAESGELLTSDNSTLAAIPILEGAIKRAQQTPNFDPALLSALQLRLSPVYLKAGRNDDALRTAQAYLATVTRQDGADSPKLAAGRLFVEEALFTLNRLQEAKDASAADYAQFLHTYGPLSRYTLSAQDMHAQAEGGLGQLAETSRDWMAMHDVTRGQPSLQYFSETAIVSAGQAECQQGRYAQGRSYLEQGMAEIATEAGPKALNYSLGALALADCMLAEQEDGSGQASSASLERVRQLLPQVDLKVIASFPGTENAEAQFYLSEARLAFSEGDVPRARQLELKAEPMLKSPARDPWEVKRLERLKSKLGGATGR